MEVSGVVELIKAGQEKGSDPLVWAIQMYSNLNSAGESLPSVELAELLVSYICWDNNVPILWKFLDKALMLRIVPPMLLLALLSVRFFIWIIMKLSFLLIFLFLKSIVFRKEIYPLLFGRGKFICPIWNKPVCCLNISYLCLFSFFFFGRVLPCRHVQPAAYRLYLELLKRHAFELKSQINRPDYQK